MGEFNNTSGTVQALEAGSDPMTYDTILGAKQPIIAGIIRSGIMVAKNGTSDDDIKTFNNLVALGHNFKEIDTKMGKDSSGKSKLRPKNVDYFTIHKKDCKITGQEVDALIKKYEDPDGKLRSFPVIFESNNWWEIIPHSLRCFDASGIRFRSNYRKTVDPSGQTVIERICEFLKDAKPGEKQHGGREVAVRGLCVPKTCVEYQKGDCKFGGSIQFVIPGVRGIGLWVIPTQSFYSLVGIRETLLSVAKKTSGKLSGKFKLFAENIGRPIFRINKVEEEVSRIDTNSGKAVRTKQWLIRLDLDSGIEISDLIDYGENVIAKGTAAMEIFSAVKSGLSLNMPDCGETGVPQEEGVAQREETDSSNGGNAPGETTTTNATTANTSETAAAAADTKAATGDSQGKGDEEGKGSKEETKSDTATSAAKASTDSTASTFTPAKAQQIKAITTVAKKHGVDTAIIEKTVAGISLQKAGELIAALNRADISAFKNQPKAAEPQNGVGEKIEDAPPVPEYDLVAFN